MAVDLARMDTVILCGGRGRRLRPLVADRPKPLADFGGMPFLGLLMEHCALFGLRRFILCAGYKGEMIRRVIKALDLPWDVRCVVEETARGTGGAVAGARRWIKSDPFFVLNGDSFCGADLAQLMCFHIKKSADVSLCVVPSRKTGRRGNIVLDPGGRVLSFEEKGRRKEANHTRKLFDNAGVYVMSRAVLRRMPRPPFSLERDFFPKMARTGEALWGRVEKKPLIDFGTPGGYRRARGLWSGGRLRLRKGPRRAKKVRGAA